MRRHSLYFIAVIVSAGIAMLVARLAVVQSNAGAAYPAYSSLRADARGLKAMFDVAELVGREAIRSYAPIEELSARNSTIVTLGLPVGTLVAAVSLPGSRNPAVLAAAGNTVILGLAGDCHYAKIDVWQLKLLCGDEGQYFDASSSWRVQDTNSFKHARILERKFGKGEVVLFASSGTLTNGFLARQRRGALLSALLERRPTVIFDEEHLGVTDATSVGALLRRYRLHGVVLAALVVFALFLWKNTSSFLPPVEAPSDEIGGRDAAAGLANLLRRSIPLSSAVSTAIAEWAKSAKDPKEVNAIGSIAARHNNPVDAYNAVARTLYPKRNLP